MIGLLLMVALFAAGWTARGWVDSRRRPLDLSEADTLARIRGLRW